MNDGGIFTQAGWIPAALVYATIKGLQFLIEAAPVGWKYGASGGKTGDTVGTPAHLTLNNFQ
jgi:hypothetical protein